MGGYMQPQGHFQMLVNMVDLGMSPQTALDAPRWQIGDPAEGVGSLDEGGVVMVEDSWSTDTLAELARRGHRLAPVNGFGRVSFGGGQIIYRDPKSGVLFGGSDPRKDGCAVDY